MSGLKIAITAWRSEDGWTAKSLREQGQLAESLGFHSYWLPENHFGDNRAIPSPLTLLAAVAASTESLILGTTSYLLPIRHPIQAAEEVAVLDQMSGGRLILGLGRGIQDRMFEAFGIDQRDKRTLFQNNLDIMLKAWRGDSLLDDDGETVRLAPLPLQQPHPPLWVAAFGPLALKQVGKLGLPYLSSPIEPLNRLAENYALHREAGIEAGQALPKTVPVMRTVFITDKNSLAADVKEATAKTLPPALRKKTTHVDDWAIIGDRPYVQDKLAEYVEQLGISHLIGGGRLPHIDNSDLLRSHEALASMASQISRQAGG
jgi:alkanesulfonate monooxygenase SsuD/methylene tetrahydromethanopterin reductase-like flavin-dependent oxidoreductase (luciferase family)